MKMVADEECARKPECEVLLVMTMVFILIAGVAASLYSQDTDASRNQGAGF